MHEDEAPGSRRQAACPVSVACQGGDPGSAPPPSGPPVRKAQRPVLSLRGLFFFFLFLFLV